jgi:hypothetical protein
MMFGLLDPTPAGPSPKNSSAEYTVRSVYFDSPQFNATTKIDGVRPQKFRIRGYNLQQEDSLTFLEIKRRTRS